MNYRHQNTYILHYMKLQKSIKMASTICPESELEALGGCNGCSTDQLSDQVKRLTRILENESQKYEYLSRIIQYMLNYSLFHFHIRSCFADMLIQLMTLE